MKFSDGFKEISEQDAVAIIGQEKFAQIKAYHEKYGTAEFSFYGYGKSYLHISFKN